MKKAYSILTKSFFLLGILVSIIGSISSVKAPPQIVILSHTGYIDLLGFYNVVGEVQNTGDQAARYVEIIATFYNSSNVVVGTSFTYSDVSVLSPERKSPFRILLADTTQVLKTDHYSLNVDFTPAASLPQGLEILSHSSYTDTLDFIHIVGEVKNIGNAIATYVQVIATCYDDTGKVVEEGFTFSNPNDIEAGQTAPFEILITGENKELVTSYTLTAESTQYAEIPEFNSYLALLLTVGIACSIIMYKRKTSAR